MMCGSCIAVTFEWLTNFKDMKKEPIFSTKYWKVILADEQAYVGRLILVLQGECSALPELSLEEQKDFFDLIRNLENIYRKEFSATMFNYSCLMNHAYRDGKRPHVHWHFRPRYERPVDIDGFIVKDPNFGNHYLPESLQDLEDKTPQHVREYISATLNKQLSLL
jgi:diadenosine tetraphosphate (Ap4A) HIT family hydrolase